MCVESNKHSFLGKWIEDEDADVANGEAVEVAGAVFSLEEEDIPTWVI